MQRWKRTILHTGVSLSIAGGGALIAAEAAGAHDATDSSSPGGPPHPGAFHHGVQGVVATVGPDTFTVTTHKGTSTTIDTTSTTTFRETGTPTAPTGVTVGETVAVTLDPTATTPTAVHVTVLLDRVSGKVTAVSSTSITLAGPRDAGREIVLSPSTMFFTGQTATSGVTVGEFATAFGTRDTSTPTDLEALFVDIFPTAVHPVPVTPTLPNPVGPHHDDNGVPEHASTTTTTATGGTLPTPPVGTSGRGGPGPSGGAHNDVGDNDGPGDNDPQGDDDPQGDIDGHGGSSGGGSSDGGNGSSGHGRG
jgi:eukaryotic-like serine/threonine-protein kinase